jgi:hypothetical protein
MHGDMIIQYEDSCAPDMHEVTEKEWAEFMERVKTLERTALICKEVGKDFICETVEYRERAGKELRDSHINPTR